jgi:hypothetical protein
MLGYPLANPAKTASTDELNLGREETKKRPFRGEGTVSSSDDSGDEQPLWGKEAHLSELQSLIRSTVMIGSLS